MSDHDDDAALDALFAQARAAEPAPPDALMARILRDAAAARGAPARSAPQPARGVRGWGGAAAAAALAACAMMGFWVGFAGIDAGIADAFGQADALAALDRADAVLLVADVDQED